MSAASGAIGRAFNLFLRRCGGSVVCIGGASVTSADGVRTVFTAPFPNAAVNITDSDSCEASCAGLVLKALAQKNVRPILSSEN